MADLPNFQYIEAFVKGQLSDQEAKSFQAKLKSDPSLKEEYEAYLATQKAIDILAIQQIKFEKENHSKNRNPIIRNNKLNKIYLQ